MIDPAVLNYKENGIMPLFSATHICHENSDYLLSTEGTDIVPEDYRSEKMTKVSAGGMELVGGEC